MVDGTQPSRISKCFDPVGSELIDVDSENRESDQDESDGADSETEPGDETLEDPAVLMDSKLPMDEVATPKIRRAQSSSSLEVPDFVGEALNLAEQQPLAKPQAGKKTGKPKPKAKADAKKTKDMTTPPKSVDDQDDKKMNRKNVYSRAYHAYMQKLGKTSMDPVTMRERARAEASSAVDRFFKHE